MKHPQITEEHAKKLLLFISEFKNFTIEAKISKLKEYSYIKKTPADSAKEMIKYLETSKSKHMALSGELEVITNGIDYLQEKVYDLEKQIEELKK